MPNAYRETANVLLDAVSAYDSELGIGPQNEAAMELALARLADVRAIEVDVDDETDDIRVRADNLLIATVTLLSVFIDLI